ncbi:flagellar basal body rod protein FlgB [Devosia lacusdianchii]|uniref:flagellar basal body rod protein FlgB n=1 Tax=Devosia lacusdianchii TaxID=2917991 RepID=UPI001F059B57|nr:flagellar basal body rod protein FlgB [Devosia sp. JXJ CY 41]
MRWHQTRQGLLAENVANAETPGYRGRDLAQYDFAEQSGAFSSATVSTTATQPMHFSVASSEGGAFGAQRMANFEITPEGNGVTLEDEMMKVTTNLMDYQAATGLYSKSIKILRTALGRQA